MFTLATTSYFDRRVPKFTRTHPEQKKHLAKVLRGLEANPFQPTLREHALRDQGDLLIYLTENPDVGLQSLPS